MKKIRIGSSSVVARLAAANLKKKKRDLITLMLFILLATMFLNIAFVILTQKENFYREAEDRTHGPQFDALVKKNLYRDEYEDFIREDERVSEYEKEEVLYMESCENSPVNMSLEAQLMSLGTERSIGKFRMTGGYSLEECEAHGISREEAIYLPETLVGYVDGLGSTYEIEYQGKIHKFKVAGFFDAIHYQNPATASSVKYFISEERFEQLSADMESACLLSVRFKETGDLTEISGQFKKDFLENTRFETTIQGLRYGLFDRADMQLTVYTMLDMGVAILLLATVLFITIVLIVMVNSIRENIEDSYQEMGILEAMGYHSRQISASYLLEYGVMAAIASLLGSLASILFCKLALSSLLTGISGIICNTHVDVLLGLLSVAVILGMCLLFVCLPLRKIRSCTILTALRKGKETHSFGKNVFPLHKGRGSVHTRLALKNVWTGRRQNLMLGITLFFCMVIFGMFLTLYVTFADGKPLMEMGGIELSDLQLVVAEGVDVKEFSEELSKYPEIRKTNASCIQNLRIDGQQTMTIISNDFSKMETLKVTQGDSPRYENEIVLSEKLCSILGKEIGESVKVSLGGQEISCYITGTIPVCTNGGLAALLGENSMKLLQNDYQLNSIDIYFAEGIEKADVIAALSEKYKIADQKSLKKALGTEESEEETGEAAKEKYSEAARIAEKKIEKLLSEYGMSDISYSVMLDGEIILKGDSSAYKIQQVDDALRKLSDQLGYLSDMFYLTVVILMAVSIVLVAGILSMMVRSRIRKNREEYGIYKSMGYTTLELMKQNALSYAVSAAVGGMAGILVTCLTGNQVLQLFFVNVLGSRIQVKFDYLYLIGSGVFLILFVFVFSMIKSWKIRKISAYSLITE